jgi:aspartate 1-decarboxylase
MEEAEADRFTPSLVYLDEHNAVRRTAGRIAVQAA